MGTRRGGKVRILSKWGAERQIGEKEAQHSCLCACWACQQHEAAVGGREVSTCEFMRGISASKFVSGYFHFEITIRIANFVKLSDSNQNLLNLHV